MKHMYKSMAIALSLVLAITAVIAANPATGEARVRLNKKKVTLTVGKDTMLKVLGTKKMVKWTSSNESVAFVVTQGKNKGRIITLNPGKARITAKVNKKKYRCTVTVKKKPSKSKPVRITPIPTVNPTAAPTMTPIPTATPIVTMAPDVNNDVNKVSNSTLAANLVTSLEKLPSGQIIAKVTNKNNVKVSSYTLNFQLNDNKGVVVKTDTEPGSVIAAGATKYMLVSAGRDVEKIDVNKSKVSVTADNEYEYFDGSSDLKVTWEAADEGQVALTCVNNSSHRMNGEVMVVYRDAAGQIVAVKTVEVSCTAGETIYESVNAPTYYYDIGGHKSYENVEYATFEVLHYSHYILYD